MSALSLRALNRTLLRRQLLDARADVPVAEAVARLLAVQAQEPNWVFAALWSRVAGLASTACPGRRTTATRPAGSTRRSWSPPPGRSWATTSCRGATSGSRWPPAGPVGGPRCSRRRSRRGFVAATWTVDDGALAVHPLAPLPAGAEGDVRVEATRMAVFLDLDPVVTITR